MRDCMLRVRAGAWVVCISTEYGQLNCASFVAGIVHGILDSGQCVCVCLCVCVCVCVAGSDQEHEPMVPTLLLLKLLLLTLFFALFLFPSWVGFSGFSCKSNSTPHGNSRGASHYHSRQIFCASHGS